MKPQDKDIKIIFEDNHLLCLDKPAGLATQSSEDNLESLETWAKEYIKKTYEKPGNVFLHAVHRLDKKTSGIVIFAKTSKALSRLNELMRAQGFQKTYVAELEGILAKQSGTLEHYLVHGDHKADLASQSDKEAKKCTLDYKVIKKEQGKTTVEILLHTGRYHQIRAQCAAIGHPVVGDTTYNAKLPYAQGAIALCHSKVCFIHPVTKEELTLYVTH